ncbi:hypothetical protein [Nonomuraea dietziae]|jgi:hypothetical protein|uniref:Uncharacterized protein n=1 Tax=Nonomuraea dietziae TaxID=65515 RepID=A0A7W5YSY6_9ACTN|nr:hypothetical protein [Nonomuraea dietziae]MBB3729654.1 hypothetical protein [Nonomuraea dietziae]
MPHVLRPAERERFRLTLNSDGRSHPVENLLSIGTLLCGLVAFAATFFPGGHVVASWVGALGFGGGLYSQYVSATTAERTLNIVGIVASFVGVALGIARGGFIP